MNHKPKAMEKTAKIYVAGHRGLVGSAVVRALQREGYSQIITRPREQLDLTQKKAVEAFFSEKQPDYVFLCAAKVGGIWANQHYPGTFIAENLFIQNNVIEAARQYQVKRLLFLGSSCIYPRACKQPIQEASLLTGPLESTNRPYAVAKIAGIEMCWAYNRQYGTRFLAVMPTNVFGPGDNYDLRTSHVIPALIRKMHEAKCQARSEVVIWGTGRARREFLYSDDLAEACLFVMNTPEADFQELVGSPTSPPLLNIGYGADLSIAEVAQAIQEIVAFPGKLVFDTTCLEGTPQKWLDSSRISAMGWKPKRAFKKGLALSYAAFQDSLVAQALS